MAKEEEESVAALTDMCKTITAQQAQTTQPLNELMDTLHPRPNGCQTHSAKAEGEGLHPATNSGDITNSVWS